MPLTTIINVTTNNYCYKRTGNFSIMTHERVFCLPRKKEIQSPYCHWEKEITCSSKKKKEITCRLLCRRRRYVSFIDILWLIITSLFFSFDDFLFNFELDNECLFVLTFTAVIVNPPIVGGLFLLQSFFSDYNSQRTFGCIYLFASYYIVSALFSDNI